MICSINKTKCNLLDLRRKFSSTGSRVSNGLIMTRRGRIPISVYGRGNSRELRSGLLGLQTMIRETCSNAKLYFVRINSRNYERTCVNLKGEEEKERLFFIFEIRMIKTEIVRKRFYEDIERLKEFFFK